jgi:hypothetical protein
MGKAAKISLKRVNVYISFCRTFHIGSSQGSTQVYSTMGFSYINNLMVLSSQGYQKLKVIEH